MPLDITLKPGLKSQADLPRTAGSGGPNPFDQFDNAQGGPANPFDAFDEQAQAAPQRSLGDSLAYIGHRGADALATLPGAPADIAVGLGNLISRQFGGPQAADSGPIGSDAIHGMFHDVSQAGSKALGLGDALTYDAPGEPQNALERYGGNIATFAGGGLGGGLARGAVRTAIGGGGALSVAQDIAPDNPYVQMMAAVLGSHGRQLATRGGQLVRGSLRGGVANAAEMRNNLEAFDRIAAAAQRPIQVNPGQLASGHNQMQVVDAGLARSPGGQPGVMNANASQQVGAAEAVENVARAPARMWRPGRTPNPTVAGDAIRAGATDFAERFQARARQVEQNFEQRIGNQTRTPVTNTQRALTDLRMRASTDPAIQALIRDPYIHNVNEAVTNASSGLVNAAGTQITRAGAPTLSFGAMRALRTDVGELLSKASISPVLREGQLKHLYAALTEDLTAAARQAGVGQEWARYNQWYAAGSSRIAKTLDKAIKGREQAPEAIFNAVMNMDRRQAFQIMRSLGPEERATVAAQALREMGQTTAAGAVSEGAAYSYSTFIRNLTDMRQRGTLDAIFGQPEFRPIRRLLNDLETTSEAALRANKVAHDVSGAANLRGQVAIGIVGTAFYSPMTAIGLFALAWPGTAGAGRLLRSRPFLRWLAGTKSVPPQNWPQYVLRLNAVVNADPTLKEAIDGYRQGLTSAAQQSQQQDPDQAAAPSAARSSMIFGMPRNWTGRGGPLEEPPTPYVGDASAARRVQAKARAHGTPREETFLPGVSTPLSQLNNQDPFNRITPQQRQMILESVARMTPPPAAPPPISQPQPGEMNRFVTQNAAYQSGRGTPVIRGYPTASAGFEMAPENALIAMGRRSARVTGEAARSDAQRRQLQAGARATAEPFRNDLRRADVQDAKAVEADAKQTAQDNLRTILRDVEMKRGAKGVAEYISQNAEQVAAVLSDFWSRQKFVTGQRRSDPRAS